MSSVQRSHSQYPLKKKIISMPPVFLVSTLQFCVPQIRSSCPLITPVLGKFLDPCYAHTSGKREPETDGEESHQLLKFCSSSAIIKATQVSSNREVLGAAKVCTARDPEGYPFSLLRTRSQALNLIFMVTPCSSFKFVSIIHCTLARANIFCKLGEHLQPVVPSLCRS